MLGWESINIQLNKKYAWDVNVVKLVHTYIVIVFDSFSVSPME